MSRREATIALLALCAAPGSLLAQAGARTYRVAVLFAGSADSERGRLEAFQRGLLQHGYKESGNLKLELSYAEGRADRVIE